jgi:hypothetical protein
MFRNSEQKKNTKTKKEKEREREMPPKGAWQESKKKVNVWAKWMREVGEDEKRFVRRDMWRHLPLVNSAEHQIVLASDNDGYFLTLVSATSRKLLGVREHAEAFASVNFAEGQEFGTYFFVGSKSGELARVDGLDPATDDSGTKEKLLPEYRSMDHFYLDQRPRFLPLGPAALYRGIWVEHKNGTERTLREKENYFKKNAVKIAKSGLDKFLHGGLFEAGENWRMQDPFLNKFISESQKAHLAVFFNEPDEAINLGLLSFHTGKIVARVVCAVRGCPFVFVDDVGAVWVLNQADEECEVAFRTVSGGCTAWTVRQFLFWITSTAEEKHKLVWNRFVFEFVGLTLRGQSRLDHQSLDTLVVLVKGDQMAIKFLNLTVKPTTWEDEFKELKRRLPSNSAVQRESLMDVFKMPLRNTDGKPPSMVFEGQDAGFALAPGASAPAPKRPTRTRLQRISVETLSRIAQHAVNLYNAELKAGEAEDGEAKEEEIKVDTQRLLGSGTNGAVYAVNNFALKLSLVDPGKTRHWMTELDVSKIAAGKDAQDGPGPLYLSGGTFSLAPDSIGFLLMERMQTSLRDAVEENDTPLQWAGELLEVIRKAAERKLVCTDVHLGNWMVNMRGGKITKLRMIDFGACEICGVDDEFGPAYTIQNVRFEERENITNVIELYLLVHFLSSCQIVLWNDLWSPGIVVILKRVNALVAALVTGQPAGTSSLINRVKRALLDKGEGKLSPLEYWVFGENIRTHKTRDSDGVNKVATASFGRVKEFETMQAFIDTLFEKGEKGAVTILKRNKN